MIFFLFVWKSEIDNSKVPFLVGTMSFFIFFFFFRIFFHHPISGVAYWQTHPCHWLAMPRARPLPALDLLTFTLQGGTVTQWEMKNGQWAKLLSIHHHHHHHSSSNFKCWKSRFSWFLWTNPSKFSFVQKRCVHILPFEFKQWLQERPRPVTRLVYNHHRSWPSYKATQLYHKSDKSLINQLFPILLLVTLW